MNRLFALLLWACTTSLGLTQDLSKLSLDFINALKVGDVDKLEPLILEDASTRDEFLSGVPDGAKAMAEQELELRHVNRELIIGDIGMTLLGIRRAGGPKFDFDPLIFRRSGDQWKMFPWANESHLKEFFSSLSPEEQSDVRLLQKWAQALGKMLNAELAAEQANAKK